MLKSVQTFGMYCRTIDGYNHKETISKTSESTIIAVIGKHIAIFCRNSCNDTNNLTIKTPIGHR